MAEDTRRRGSSVKRRSPMRRINCSIAPETALIAASLCAAACASAFADDVEFYLGRSQIVRLDGEARFDDAPYMRRWPTYHEGGLDIHLDDDIWHHSPSIGLPDLPLYFANGGHTDVIVITKSDGGAFDALEANVSNGWNDPEHTWIWIQAWHDGELVGESDLDALTGETIGVMGEFDEVRIGAYESALIRDQHNRANLNAIAMDDIRFGATDAGGFTLAIDGSCPGAITASVRGASPSGAVAYIYALGDGSAAIPGGPCGGVQLGLNRTAALAGMATADSEGGAQFSGRVPVAACGRVVVQALDLTTCGTSNIAEL